MTDLFSSLSRSSKTLWLQGTQNSTVNCPARRSCCLHWSSTCHVTKGFPVRWTGRTTDFASLCLWRSSKVFIKLLCTPDCSCEFMVWKENIFHVQRRSSSAAKPSKTQLTNYRPAERWSFWWHSGVQLRCARLEKLCQTQFAERWSFWWHSGVQLRCARLEKLCQTQFAATNLVIVETDWYWQKTERKLDEAGLTFSSFLLQIVPNSALTVLQKIRGCVSF